jgi:hypothetical protein
MNWSCYEPWPRDDLDVSTTSYKFIVLSLSAATRKPAGRRPGPSAHRMHAAQKRFTHSTDQNINTGISVFLTYETGIPVIQFQERKSVVASYLGDKYVMSGRHTLLLQNCIANG